MPAEIPPDLQGYLFAGTADQGSIAVYDHTDKITDPPTLTSQATLNSGHAFLVGTQGGFCQGCDFITWGLWGASLDFQNPNSENQGEHQVTVAGWWISGDVVSPNDLPTRGTASYAGNALVVNSNVSEGVPYSASGDMSMS